jgi:hypothetical protein
MSYTGLAYRLPRPLRRHILERHRHDRGTEAMSGTGERVTLTRRRGDAEKDAEKNQAGQNLSTRRDWRDVGWRHRPVTDASPQSPRISADSVLSGFDSLIGVLRVSAAPRQIHSLSGSGFSGSGATP